ncbi:hypothetical protein [Nocardioides sp.]|uniref:hypothetical protein n=1 Tax=Nocardioides sp. TaxID=35761 RepID=UPI002D1B1598|nr:hypothetical protein [Nocardioides sp.]HXH79495.1 hypothetical protein [Nocardioides sp.]
MATPVIHLHQGDAYTVIGQGPPAWTLANAPNLAGATIALQITRNGAVVVAAAGTLASGVYPAAQVVHTPLTAQQTAGLGLVSYGYRLIATLSNGDVVTLDHGDTGSVLVTRAQG